MMKVDRLSQVPVHLRDLRVLAVNFFNLNGAKAGVSR